jgi:hypothetical protein
MMSTRYPQSISITFGECAENHVGMQMVGSECASGFTVQELEQAKAKFEAVGLTCELVPLTPPEACPEDQREDAAVLIIRQAVPKLLELGAGVASGIADADADAGDGDGDGNGHGDGSETNGNATVHTNDLRREMTSLKWDSKAFMYGRVVDKHARYNLVFSEEAQAPDYANKKGTIVEWARLPLLASVRNQLGSFLGPKADRLQGEGNLYFDASKCGIGYHGDAERKIVVAIRLGYTNPLHYTWFRKFKPVSDTVKLTLHDGDMYVMSEKATGNDWKSSSKFTLRHAAGAAKFLKLPGEKAASSTSSSSSSPVSNGQRQAVPKRSSNGGKKSGSGGGGGLMKKVRRKKRS